MSQLRDDGSWWPEGSNNNKELTIAFVTISVVIFVALWNKFRLSRDAPPLPRGPRSLPIVGYLPFLRLDLHKQLTNMAHSYGPIFKFHLGSKLYVVISTPELAKEVVRDQDEAFSNRDITVAASVITYGGQDIVVSKNNSNWRKLRKILVCELLSNKNLKACASLRKDEVRKTIKNIFNKIGTPVNISQIAFLTEANVITNMIWKKSLDEGAHLGDGLQMVSSDIVDIFGKPNLSDFFPSLAWFDLQGIERDMKKQLNKLDQILTSIIEDRIKSNLERSRDGVAHEEEKDFLQMLLDLNVQKDITSGTSLSTTQIKAVLVNILIAGTETTTTLAEWAMTEILHNHNVMIKVQEELTKIVGSKNIVEESHLSQLQYLDATIKETFRLHPVVPFLMPRSPSHDCFVGGYTIPKGCTIFLNVWSIHRDPRYWDNPLDFNPERFLTNKYDYYGNNLKFFPFGSGRRICAGIPLAEKMQMFILASLLHSFDWSLPISEEHDLSEKFGITLKKTKSLIAMPTQRLPDTSLYT